MIIKTSKGNSFKLIPEGEQRLLVTDVKLVPAGRPQFIEFYYAHSDGGTMRDRLDLNHEVAVSILGKRVDVAMQGNMPEGTEVEVADIPPMFKGKYVTAIIKHNVVEKNGETKTYANIKVITEVDADEEDDL